MQHIRWLYFIMGGSINSEYNDKTFIFCISAYFTLTFSHSLHNYNFLNNQYINSEQSAELKTTQLTMIYESICLFL